VQFDEQPDLLSCEFQVRQHLGSVHRQQSLNCSDFDGSRNVICFHPPPRLCSSEPSVVQIPEARVGVPPGDCLPLSMGVLAVVATHHSDDRRRATHAKRANGAFEDTEKARALFRELVQMQNENKEQLESFNSPLLKAVFGA
jgi:hypothetical protein